MDVQDLKKELGRAHNEAFNYLQLENRYLKKLLEATRMVASADFIEFLKFIVETITELTQAMRGVIFLCEEKEHKRYPQIVSSGEESLEAERLDFCTTIIRRVEETGRAELIENVPDNALYNLTESVQHLKLKALMCLPLKSDDRLIGFLYLDSNQGNHNFSLKNLKLLEAFAAQASLAIEQGKLVSKIRKDNVELKRELQGTYSFGELIWVSKAMKKTIQTLHNVLDNKVTVSIYGETGTGKELIARAIHYNGNRKNEKFISQNCGALTLSLLESELFGHKKGAFTGAHADKAGLFEAAHKGTIFLDEVGEMSPEVQIRFLRVLETGTIRRIGDTEDRKIDVRVITATHRNLKNLVQEGKFREDLYYRLNVFPVTIPPLRERKEDIPVLVHHFIKMYNSELDRQVDTVSPELLETLMENRWPGNIRELKNTLYRLMILNRGNRLESERETIFGKTESYKPAASPPVRLQTMEQMEREYINYVLKEVKNNKSAAAELLGLKRSTFISRLQKLGIPL